ncbi:MAG: ATP-binding protein [Thalassotalea sp.]
MHSNQKILPTRRTYNKLVANEMMEDFALRFTPKRSRQWSLNRIACTALGIVSFLVLEAIGGAITLNFGFENAAWAILAVTLVVFFTGLPISYYAAKYGVDIDLLSRGAGFGYIGSTIASLIYASFTFIFFALEAAIMSMALQILFGLPLSIGYVFSALIVLPLVTHGISYISRFQVWTQPIWIALQLLPLFYVFSHPDANFNEWVSFTGAAGDSGSQFNLVLFGAASAVLLSLVAQIGEQVDFLRFLPEKPKTGQWRWWVALVSAGPGWIIFGALKLFLGSFLAYFALQQGVDIELAGDPAHMYNLAFSYVFENPTISVIVACSFVVISQLKINVANAYAGSLAWSNFFSRVTHNHPGRVVWMIFNVGIALLLMELGIYQTIESMLSVYSVIVLAWLSSVVADLIINKPLGISPKHIEFKRSHLYDINPVGVGSMLIASFFGFTAHFGWYGATIEALASFLACFLPFITVPLIGYLTKGKYYLVERDIPELPEISKCHICENSFEHEDMTFCPAYQKPICSLCCSLDVRCGDLCRPEATLSKQSHHFFKRFLTTELLSVMTTPMAQFISVTLGLSLVGAGILFLIYLQVPLDGNVKQVFASTLIKIFFLLLIIIGIISWLFILARSGNRLALKELRSQTNALAKEMDAHTKTSQALQDAKEIAESANEAKSRYLAGLSHELRTPLNVLLGYAQLLSRDEELPERQRETLGIVRKNGEHLADLIEGLLEISKIEAGRLTLHRDEFNLKAILQQLVDMFQMQANQKSLKFYYQPSEHLPDIVAADKQRFRQILINLISNAIKYTENGSVTFKVNYRNEVASFSVIDTGVGISKDNQDIIFQPFEQIRNTHTQAIGGTGLGLTISRSLTELMGGEISLKSTLGQGSTFNLRLMLPKLYQDNNSPEQESNHVIAYQGEQKTILVVDDDVNQHRLLSDLLSPLGFNVLQANDANQGFVLIKQQTIDLIILDVRMPDIDGWQMVKMLREQGCHLPVLMVSANARDTEFDLAAEGFHNGYIAKPVNLDALLGKIGNLLKIQWQYKSADQKKDPANVSANNAFDKSLVQNEHYLELIALAEIGYLSGFKDKFAEINQRYYFPADVKSQIEEYIELCNFPKVIEYLRELIHE